MSDSSATKYVLTCPGCQKRFQLLDAAILGKRATCKSCKAPFLVDGSVLTDFAEKDLPKPKILSEESIQVQTQPPLEQNGQASLRLTRPLIIAFVLVAFLLATTFAWIGFAILGKNPTPVVAVKDLQKEDFTVVDKEPVPLEEVRIPHKKTLGLKEAFILDVMAQGKDPIRFSIESTDQEMRIYVDERSQIAFACEGNPLDLNYIALYAKTKGLLMEQGKDHLPVMNRFEACVKLAAMTIQGSLIDDAQKFLADNIVSVLVTKNEMKKSVFRGYQLSLMQQGDFVYFIIRPQD